MSFGQHFVAIDNYSYTTPNDATIEVNVGDEFVLLEEISNENLRLKSISSSDSIQNDVVLPRRILETINNSNNKSSAPIVRSKSVIQERISSLNLNDNFNKSIGQYRLSSMSDYTTRSKVDRARSFNLPSTEEKISIDSGVSASDEMELHDVEASPIETNPIEASPIEASPIEATDTSSKWYCLEENGQYVYIHMDTYERWFAAVDDTGRQYYYNETSEISAWELPEDGSNQQKENVSEADEQSHLDMVFENERRIPESEISWNKDEADRSSNAIPPVVTDGSNIEDSGSLFNIRQLKKEHISGPLHNKLIKTERSGHVLRAKVLENGVEVPANWATNFVVLTGPELLFYKDLKTANIKHGVSHGKVELRLKIQNLDFFIKPNDKTILQVEDKGAPGSCITYYLRFSSLDDAHTWKAAMQYSKDWHNENRYSEIVTKKPDQGSVSQDVVGDIQNIGIRLKYLLKRRPTRESLEVKGIIKPESVFGSSIEIICERDKSAIPEFVYRCILAIEARGVHHSGIYRISGNQAKIQKLRLAVDEYKYQLNSESIELETLTGAFKSFFKELKEPLFDDNFCENMVEIISHRKTDKKNPYRDVDLTSVRALLAKLRPSHYNTAKALMCHLHKVGSQSSKSLMDFSNLSMVWGPNLYFVSGQASNRLAMILMTHNQIIDFLMTRYEEIFEKM